MNILFKSDEAVKDKGISPKYLRSSATLKFISTN